MSPGSAVFELYPESGLLVEYLQQRFGMPADTFTGYRFWHRPGHPTLWLAAATAPVAADLCLETVGLAAFRRPPPRGFPTSAFIRHFGWSANRGVYDLALADALRLMHGGAVEVEPVENRRGPYIVRCPRAVIGRGWLRDGLLRLDVPKLWRGQLMLLEPARRAV